MQKATAVSQLIKAIEIENLWGDSDITGGPVVRLRLPRDSRARGKKWRENGGEYPGSPEGEIEEVENKPRLVCQKRLQGYRSGRVYPG